jgi:transposase-like protein
VARRVAAAGVKTWPPTSPATRTRFLAACAACVADLRCPANHHKVIRTTHLAQRSSEEARRRTQIIPHFFDEQGGRKVCSAALLRARERWPRVTLRAFDRTRLAALRDQLPHDDRARQGQVPTTPSARPSEREVAAGATQRRAFYRGHGT